MDERYNNKRGLVMNKLIAAFETNPNKVTARSIVMWIAKDPSAYYQMDESDKEIAELAKRVYSEKVHTTQDYINTWPRYSSNK